MHTSPTPGRVVYFHPGDIHPPIPYAGMPLAAIIAFVHNDRAVNLTVFDTEGHAHAVQNVKFFQDDTETSLNGHMHRYATWMPYQRAQAEKAAPAGPSALEPGSDEAIEQEIVAKGLTAPRLTPADIQEAIVGETYTRLDGTTTTICLLTLANGFTVTGESACVSAENFDQEIGCQIAYKNAVGKVWMLEGYLLAQRLHIIAQAASE